MEKIHSRKPEQLKKSKAGEPVGCRERSSSSRKLGLPKTPLGRLHRIREKVAALIAPRVTGNAKRQVAKITVARLQEPDLQHGREAEQAEAPTVHYTLLSKCTLLPNSKGRLIPL